MSPENDVTILVVDDEAGVRHPPQSELDEQVSAFDDMVDDFTEIERGS